jgi:acetyltransferase-like isoleucine patch superfamily enzyme
MIDYSTVEVRRLKDKASPATLSLSDKMRTWRLSRKPNVKIGKFTAFKENAKINICPTGSLIIGEHCLMGENSWLLLTMPQPKVNFGDWVFIGRNTVVASKNKISIGDFTCIAPNCYLIDHEHGINPDDIILNQKANLKEIHIGRDVWLGTGVIVLAGVTIGDGAVLGAGAIVTKDIPSNEIWAGNPARFIKRRA